MGQIGTLADTQWYVQQNGKPVGPLTLTVLRQLAGIGQIRPDTWLQPAGSDVWVRAASVLKNAFAPRPAAPAAPRPPVPAVRPHSVSGDSGPPTIRLRS